MIGFKLTDLLENNDKGKKISWNTTVHFNQNVIMLQQTDIHQSISNNDFFSKTHLKDYVCIRFCVINYNSLYFRQGVMQNPANWISFVIKTFYRNWWEIYVSFCNISNWNKKRKVRPGNRGKIIIAITKHKKTSSEAQRQKK